MRRVLSAILVVLLAAGVAFGAATYPASIKVFTARNTGDIIQASHVNDLQDEVNAIETGLISGLQHTLRPLTNALYDLGTLSFGWRNLYVSNSIQEVGSTAPLNLYAAGSSFVNLGSGTGQPWFVATGPATLTANFVQATGELAGVQPGINARGTDPNISLTLFAKASAQIVLGSLDAAQVTSGTFFVAQGLVATNNNYLMVTSVAPSLSPRLETVGTDANINLSLVPKGSGGVLLPASVGLRWVDGGNMDQILQSSVGNIRLDINSVGHSVWSSGFYAPVSDLGVALGTASFRWSDLRVNTATLSGAVSFGSTVALNADPTTALQATTKQYVDANAGNVALNAATTTVDVVNTVTETDLYNFTVAANTLGTNRALRFTLIGDMLKNDGGGGQVWTVRFYFGTTQYMLWTRSPAANSANRQMFTVTIDLHARGATNAQSAWGRVMSSSGQAPGTGFVDTSADPGYLGMLAYQPAMTEDTTASKVFRVSVQWGSANASLSARLLSARLELIK